MVAPLLNTFDQKVFLDFFGFFEVNLGLLSLLAVQKQGSKRKVGGPQGPLVTIEELLADLDGLQIVLLCSFHVLIKSRVFSSSEGAVDPQGAHHFLSRIPLLRRQRKLCFDVFAVHEVVQNLEGK